MNEHREGLGLNTLQWHDDVAAAALYHSEDMQRRDFFSHNSPNGNTPWNRLQDHGVSYSAAGENIAWGQRTGEHVLQSWLDSDGHRENIENGIFTHHGVGFVEDGNYWTHKFVRLR